MKVSKGEKKIIIKNSLVSDHEIVVEKNGYLIYFLNLLRGNNEGTIRIILDGQNAKCILAGLFVGGKKQTFNINTITEHLAPSTSCQILVKGILREKAVCTSNGLIKIAKNAQKSEAFLTQKTLLLSDSASADMSPTLEIEANDVKAGHAATVSQINLEELFFLQCRGLDEQLAVQMMVKGFFQDVENLFPEDLKPTVSQQIEKAMMYVN